MEGSCGEGAEVGRRLVGERLLGEGLAIGKGCNGKSGGESYGLGSWMQTKVATGVIEKDKGTIRPPCT
eukprot:6180737-Pleurochrysis_carterae.AAC.2